MITFRREVIIIEVYEDIIQIGIFISKVVVAVPRRRRVRLDALGDRCDDRCHCRRCGRRVVSLVARTLRQRRRRHWRFFCNVNATQ